ncbi:uncharacterized protein LOC125663954 [Ostrea edulis]|uniref:uncharacterized protein LOC125663954 n=1 Tax=Ostrea edulis TaxID=37623 RepID=UPI0024AFB35B|nr:uncharacterized protein LOC125663954 [Ostrea edulis]
MWRVGSKKFVSRGVYDYFIQSTRCTESARTFSCVSTTFGHECPKPVTQILDSRSNSVGHSNSVLQNVRNFTVSMVHQNQAALSSTSDSESANELAPQGIQGDDCVNFKLWMESCQRYGLPGCEDQANHIVSGRKTLSEIFHEQDQMIRDIARNYSLIKNHDKPDVDKQTPLQGVQGDFEYCGPFDSSASCIQGVQGLDILHSLVNIASPQGIQGDECIQFKLWLENCHRFGISGECEQQLHNIKNGRKTLAQIFEEQDRLIREIVQDYRSNRVEKEAS